MAIKKLNQVTDFDIKSLKIFRSVVDFGSFAAAESALGITRSAISLQMSDLENRLGVRLCNRGRAGFSLTDEGREVLSYVDTLFTSIDEFKLNINQMHQNLKGDLNVGLINNLVTQPEQKITNALKGLYRQHPNVNINLSTTTPSEIERGILDGKLHVGALPMINTVAGLEYYTLYEEKCQLYCSSRHPLFEQANSVKKEDLKEWDAVIPNYILSTHATKLHKLFKSSAHASDREGTAFLILTDLFIGFLPDHYAEQWVKSGQMRAISPKEFKFSSNISVVIKKDRRSHMILDFFLKSLDFNGTKISS